MFVEPLVVLHRDSGDTSQRPIFGAIKDFVLCSRAVELEQIAAFYRTRSKYLSQGH